MILHHLSSGPYRLLRRLNVVGSTRSYDEGSGRLLIRAGLAIWDETIERLRVTELGRQMKRTVRRAPYPSKRA